jgi:hypothetical protein
MKHLRLITLRLILRLPLIDRLWLRWRIGRMSFINRLRIYYEACHGNGHFPKIQAGFAKTEAESQGAPPTA